MAKVMLKRRYQCATLAVALLCVATMSAPGASAPAPISPAQKPEPEQLIARANHVMLTDRTQFLALIDQLHRIKDPLSPEQQQQLMLLDARKERLAGHTPSAIRLYLDVLHHPVNAIIASKARTRLIALYLLQRKYVVAYTLANALMEKLPRITNPQVRNKALQMTIRVLDQQKRWKKAIQYTHQLEANALTNIDRCVAKVFRAQELIYLGGSLASTRKDYLEAIDMCQLADMPEYPNGLREVWASKMVQEDRPDQAIAYLDQIKTATIKSGSRQHMAAIHVVYAEAYLKKGEYNLARKYARKVLSENAPDTFNWTLQYAYSFLFRINKQQGKYAAALRMFEKYVEQYKASADDAKAQAIAYQTVRQDVLTNKMQLSELSRKNKILQLRQSLDSKTAETNRLYILILLLVLASIAFWTYRIKHSQLRYRKMARHDDLTGVFNRQHFFDQVEQALQRLERAGSPASLLILDMDHFKRVNDEYGHVSGDVVLKHVARICREHLRASDMFGRLGGEEFGILMPGCTRTRAMEIGNRIRLALARSEVQLRENTRITVTSSIGLACTEAYGYALKPLLVAADDALYEAKRAGRNRLMAGICETAPAAT